MSLAVVGTGLASPFGLSPREHVIFARADVPGPATSPFLLPDDRRMRVFHCPWLDAALPAVERMESLAKIALADAIRPLAEVEAPALSLVLPVARPGIDEAGLGRLSTAIEAEGRFSAVQRFHGEAGAIAALADAVAKNAPRGDAPPTVILAVDSFIDLAFLTHRALHPRTRWEAPRPIPSEGAAAIALLPPRRAAQLGLRPLGAVIAAATAVGSARDDNDDPVDAIVMTGLIDRVAPPRVFYAFGQDLLDPLRNEDWGRATARHADRFRDCQNVCMESRAGALGAASAAASVVVGLHTLRLHAEPERLPRDEPIVAWALSGDGTRGIASVSVEGP